MADQIGIIRTPKGVTKDQFLDMVRAGTHDALVELMRAGTTDPSGAFYGAIKDGTREAMRAVVSAGQLRPVPDSASELGVAAVEGEAKS